MDLSESILLEATRKLIALRANPFWSQQMPDRFPPVLWFGNSLSPKRKVLTLGANPSRSEFLKGSTVRGHIDFCDPPRFRTLNTNENLADILTCEFLRHEIIESYDGYFSNNPYHLWFGKDSSKPYKAEGFLQGIGASYYENESQLQAIHIDLFPFATIKDFAQITEEVEEYLLRDGWIRQIVTRLVEMLKPTAVVLHGRTNCGYFIEHVDPSIANPEWIRFDAAKYFVEKSPNLGLTVVGVSTNLGNPVGFTAERLKLFGNHIRDALGYDRISLP